MPDDKLGKYQIRGQLGRGAMGTVLDGWDPILERRVAIKTVRLPAGSESEAQDDLARFRREAQAAGRLTHANIVGTYDYGETDELAYIVMEFVDGRTLKDVLDKKEVLPLAGIVRVMDDLLAGLGYSHERGVVHRDIKPANIMLTREGQAKIADFGIARIENSSMTQAGTVLGTPAYMSPEQFMGQVVDLRTDIYSAGVLLYQLLTGERPFEGGLTAIMHKVLNVPPPKPSDLSVTCPPNFDAVVARAMAKRPDERFPSAAAFAEAIRAAYAAPAARAADPLGDSDPLADEGTVVMTSSRQGAPARPVAAMAALGDGAKSGGKKNLAIGIAAAVVLAALGGAYFVLAGGSRDTAPPTKVAENGGGGVNPASGSLPPITTVPPVKPPVTAASTTPPPIADVPPPKPTPATLPTIASGTPVNPPVTTTPPPIAPAEPAALPAAVAMATRSIFDIRSDVDAAVKATPCSVLGDTVSGNAITFSIAVDGAANADAAAALRVKIDVIAAGQPVRWNVRDLDTVYCRALDIIRPIAVVGRAGGFAVTLDKKLLRKDDFIVPRVTLPDFPAHVQVAYLAHDNSVFYITPTKIYPDVAFAAHSTQPFGEKHGDFPGWQVGPPYGTDIIIAVASSAPLMAPRPAALGSDGGEADSTGYLNDLQAAIDRADKRQGGHLLATILLVDTEDAAAKP